MPESGGIEIFVREHFVSETANTVVGQVGAKGNGVKLIS
jgi:hypothetical protein